MVYLELIVFIIFSLCIVIKIVTSLIEIVKSIYWQSRLKHTITVKWPSGYVDVGPNSREWNGITGKSRQQVWTADPNDHYRPWLEAHVGKQHQDWDWGALHTNEIKITFRTGKEEWATQAALMWNQ